MTTDSPRNIVMVTADSLRADHCGFVSGESELTPAIDGLADEGLSSTQAIAPGPRTPSSVPVVFTGEFMSDDPGWTMNDEVRRQRRIGQHMHRFAHLSEALQRRGYETIGVTANPWTTRKSNFELGFDSFYEISAASDDITADQLTDSRLFEFMNAGLERLPGDPIDWSRKKEWFSQWPGHFDLIQDQLAGASEPFFLWIFLMDTHQPYITPRSYRGELSAPEMWYATIKYWQGVVADEEFSPRARELIAAAYRDAVRSVDGFVDALMPAVDSYDPVTVFFADHGEALGEHGNFGHEQTLYEENLRVPLVVHNAGSTATVGEQVPLRLFPELLRDLTDPTDFDPEAYTRQFVLSQIENNRKTSVRTDRWKLVAGDASTRLYDHRGDPTESRDVAAEYPEVASTLADVLERHRQTQTEKDAIGEATEELAGAASL